MLLAISWNDYLPVSPHTPTLLPPVGARGVYAIIQVQDFQTKPDTTCNELCITNDYIYWYNMNVNMKKNKRSNLPIMTYTQQCQ